MTEKRTIILHFAVLAILWLSLAACGGSSSGGSTPPTTFTLTISSAGTGSGTVTGNGINCGEDCTENLPRGTTVGLTAAPDSGSAFTGWGGDCSANPCTLAMNSAKTVTATFNGSGEVLSGTVQGWTGQAATVKAEAVDIGGQNLGVLAEAPLNADGTFSLTLPGAEGVAGKFAPYNPICSGEEGVIEITPSPLELITVPYLYIYSTTGQAIGSIAYESQTAFVVQAYAASAATVEGSCVYTSGDSGGSATSTEMYDINLAAGWNTIIYEGTEAGVIISTGDVPAAATWQYSAGCDPMDPDCSPTPEPAPPDTSSF